MGSAAVDVFFAHLHQHRGQHRIDDQRHEEGRAQHNDQGHGQIAHELPNQTRPHGQGQKGRQGGGRGSDDGPCHLSHTILRSIVGTVAFIHQSVHVLHHHNPIVHQHAQGQHQRKQDHGIERHPQGVQDQEAHEHGERNGHPHKQSIPKSKKEQQHPHHQQHPKNDGVLKLLQLGLRHVALIVGDGHPKVPWQHVLTGLVDDGVDRRRRLQQILPRPLHHIQRHHGSGVLAGIAFSFFFNEGHLGNIAQMDDVPSFSLDDDVFQFLGAREISLDLDASAHAVHQQVTT